MQSHYLFEDRFGRPGKGNDKGKVEGMVGYARRNFLVPVPRVESFEALNAHLEQRCLERMDATLRGHTETIGQRMERDLDALLPLPAVPYDAGDKQPSRVSSLSLVRYRTNDYSAPVAYGHREVLVRGYVDQVVISCGAEVIARHPRSYEQDDFVFDPIHYLPLLERKTAALDQAAPLQGWDLPEEYQTLRRLLEARISKREFVRWRLLELEVHHAVKDALRLGAISFDAVKHLLLCRIEGRPPRLDLDLIPTCPGSACRPPAPGACRGGGSRSCSTTQGANPIGRGPSRREGAETVAGRLVRHHHGGHPPASPPPRLGTSTSRSAGWPWEWCATALPAGPMQHRGDRRSSAPGLPASEVHQPWSTPLEAGTRSGQLQRQLGSAIIDELGVPVHRAAPSRQPYRGSHAALRVAIDSRGVATTTQTLNGDATALQPHLLASGPVQPHVGVGTRSRGRPGRLSTRPSSSCSQMRDTWLLEMPSQATQGLDQIVHPPRWTRLLHRLAG